MYDQYDSKEVFSLRSNKLAAVVVWETSNDDEDDIDDVPDTESTAGGELQQGRDDVAEVEAVNSIAR